MTALAFIAPQVPVGVSRPPEGADWIHEIKHDGFRALIANVVYALFILATIEAASAQATGKSPTGVDLYKVCLSVKKASIEDKTCDVYLRAFFEGLFYGQNLSAAKLPSCLPDESIDIVQIRAIVEKFMRDHPEQLNQDAPFVVWEALARAFPCAH